MHVRTRSRMIGAALTAAALVTVAAVAVTDRPTSAHAATPATPAGAPGPLPSTAVVPMSGRDRVYSADQTSNTVTVVDPSTDKVIGTIALGAQRLSNELNPQYVGDINVHGLAYAPGRRRLAVVSIGSNTVDIIDTATNTVLSHTDVGRSSHEGWFTADGNQFWVADRGRDTITVVDAVHGGVLGTIQVGAGPSKVVMSGDGQLAYVNHTNLAEITIVDVASRKVVGTIGGLGDVFSSDLAISPDSTELWVPHKRVGKVTVVDLVQRKVTAVLTTGPDTNHPNFADTPAGRYAYVTVGGLDETLVYKRTRGGTPTLVKRIYDHGHAPHGVWPSGDFTRVYVGMEKSDGLDVIDTRTNKVIDTIATGQEPQAVIYVPDAAPAADHSNLGTQGLGQQGHDIPTTLPDGHRGDTLDPTTGRHLEATIRTVAGLDQVGLQARGLDGNTAYQALSVGDDQRRTPVVTFTTDASGNAPQVLAFTVFTGRSITLRRIGAAARPASATITPSGNRPATHVVTAMDLFSCCCC